VNVDAALDEFVRHLRTERGLSPHTITAYESDLRSLLAFLSAREPTADAGAGTRPITVDVITLDSLRDWLWAETQAGLTNKSLARRTSSVRAFTGWLARTNNGSHDAGARLKTPKPGSSLPRVLTQAAMTDILDGLSVAASGNDPMAIRRASGSANSPGSTSTIWPLLTTPFGSRAKARRSGLCRSAFRPGPR